MSKLFGRNINIIVGDGSSALNIPNTFKIAIDLIKTNSSKSSTRGNCTIWNLSEQNKAFIRESGRRVRIEAGYTNDVSLLHDGEILRTIPDDEVTDRKTIITLSGKISSTNTALFSKSYTGAVSVRKIVSDALPTFGLTFDKLIVGRIPAGLSIPNFSFLGKTSDLLDNLLAPIGIQWLENNSQIFFSEKSDKVLSASEEVFVLNQNTGLIKTAMQTNKGVNAVCLMNPKLQVENIVKIESDVVRNAAFNTFTKISKTPQAQGFYKIIQVSYKGDNWDGKFETLIQCVPFSSSATSQ